MQEIEKEGEQYGMKLNHGKCELIAIRGNGKVTFRNGTKVPKNRSEISRM